MRSSWWRDQRKDHRDSGGGEKWPQASHPSFKQSQPKGQDVRVEKPSVNSPLASKPCSWWSKHHRGGTRHTHHNPLSFLTGGYHRMVWQHSLGGGGCRTTVENRTREGERKFHLVVPCSSSPPLPLDLRVRKQPLRRPRNETVAALINPLPCPPFPVSCRLYTVAQGGGCYTP